MIDAALRAFIRRRAGRRCEYCRLHEDDDDLLPFHVEHVIAKQHGGNRFYHSSYEMELDDVTTIVGEKPLVVCGIVDVT